MQCNDTIYSPERGQESHKPFQITSPQTNGLLKDRVGAQVSKICDFLMFSSSSLASNQTLQFLDDVIPKYFPKTKEERQRDARVSYLRYCAVKKLQLLPCTFFLSVDHKRDIISTLTSLSPSRTPINLIISTSPSEMKTLLLRRYLYPHGCL